MIQRARSASSVSLLRELEESIINISDYSVGEFFDKQVQEVIENRRDPDKTITGATELKRNLLAYLEQQGEIHTVNIWIRSFKIAQYDDLKTALDNELKKIGAEGVLEIHLQDREINSPHLQFVGTNAKAVEKSLAELVVKMGFETTVEEAMSTSSAPFYQYADPKLLQTKDLSVELQTHKHFEEIEATLKAVREDIKVYVDRIAEKRNDFRVMMDQFKEQHSERMEKYKSRIDRLDWLEEKREVRKTELDDLLSEWKSNKTRRQR
jgi:hypothetical protein